MAKQNSIVKIRGTIDDLTFLETKDGHEVRRKKRSPSKEQLAANPNYDRHRENWDEFRRAAHASRIIRKEIAPMMINCKNTRIASTLTKEMLRIVKTDGANRRGQRTVQDGDISLLNGFTFSKNAELSVILKADINTAIDRAAGTLTVNIGAFDPMVYLQKPPGATHCMISAMACEFNFETEQAITDSFESVKMSLDGGEIAAQNAVMNVTPASTNPLVLVMGITFYDFVNGLHYPLKNGAFNALAVLATDRS